MTPVLAVGFALVVLKTALLESFRFRGVLPDPFLALAVYSSLFLGARGGFVAGMLLGCLVGLECPERAALFPALYGAVGWISGIGWERFLRESFASEFAFLFGLGLVADGVLLVAEYGAGGASARAILMTAVPSALVTAALAPFAYAAVRDRVFPWTGGMPRRAYERHR